MGVNQGPGAIQKSLDDIQTISLSANVSGYVIHLSVNNWPMNDPNGVPMVVGAWESYPLPLPPGITIKGHVILAPTSIGSWSSSPTTGPFFEFVEAPNSNYSGAAKLIDINFLGGDTALSFAANNGSTPLFVVIKGCRFKGNGVAVDTSAAAVQDYSIRVEDCVISDAAFTTYQTIQYTPSRVGLRFKATQGSSLGTPPHVTGEVINLSIAGQYPSGILDPTPPIGVGEGNDLVTYTPPAGSAGEFTRAIEVHVRGNVSLLEFDGLSAQQTVAAVDLDVSGGLLDGGAAAGTSRGWDVGVYAMAEDHGSSGGGVGNYSSRYSVDITGTVIEEFRAAGVYAQVGQDTRGHLGLNGLAEVRWTGIQDTTQSNDVLSTGVHAVARLGLLSVVTDRAFIHDNRGNGVLCFSPGTAISGLPFGLYLEMKRTGIHHNGRSGIILDGGYGHAGFGQVQGGVVGGTRDLTAGGDMSLVRHASKPFFNALPYHGQGVINGCAISAEDGRYGILCRVRGSSLRPNTNDTIENFSAASCRIVNTYVWGFDLGGYLADLDRAPNAALESGPTLLTPIIHSTLVNNPVYSVEIVEQSPNAAYRYYRDDPVGGEYLNTMIAHSVFDTRSGQPDFGPNLDPDPNLGGIQQWAIDDGFGAHATDIDKPHVVSIRAVFAHGTTTGMDSYTDDVPDYVGSPAGFNPDQWFLSSTMANDELDETATFLNAGGDLESEADTDIENYQRPTLASGNRDKGGEED